MWHWKDRLGIFASVACAIHCAATPFLLAALPTLKLTEWMASPQFHQWAAVICSGFVAMAIWPAFLRYRDYRILVFSTTGLSLILSAAFLLPDECCSGELPNHVVKSTAIAAPVKGTPNHLVAMESKDSCADAACCSDCQSSAVAGVSTSEGNATVTPDDERETDPNGHNAIPSAHGSHSHDDDHAGHDHAGHNHAGHDHAGHEHAGHDHAGHEHDASSDQSNSQMALVVAGLSPVQPWLTPVGGLLLILAHGLNLRRRRDPCVACCEPSLPTNGDSVAELARAS